MNKTGELTDVVNLTLKKVFAQACIGRNIQLNSSFDVQALRDMFADQLLARLWGYIAFESIEKETKTVDFKIPSSWWQMFKRDVCPFLLKWFPLKAETIVKEIEIEYGRVYPSMEIQGHKSQAMRFVQMPYLRDKEEVPDEYE